MRLAIMDFNEFAQMSEDCHTAENGFLIWKITSAELFRPCWLSGGDSRLVIHILVQKGTLDVRFKGKVYHMVKSSYGHFIGEQSLELLSVSGNVRAYLMACNDPYIAALLKNNPPMPFSLTEKAQERPVNLLDSDVMPVLRYRMDCIEKASRNDDHIFRNEMIKCSIWMLLLDISDIYIRRESEKGNMPTGRKKEIFISFMQLLTAHVCQHHSVGFYASELCITPQYLNRIVKFHTGKTVYEWICHSLVGEIAKQLENTNDTMQQIANRLNFPDQVTLTKFFKRQTGYSLSEYRRNLAVKQLTPA